MNIPSRPLLYFITDLPPEEAPRLKILSNRYYRIANIELLLLNRYSKISAGLIVAKI
jgi:hypothetical protein